MVDEALTRVERQFEMSGLLARPLRQDLHDWEIFDGDYGAGAAALLVPVPVVD